MITSRGVLVSHLNSMPKPTYFFSYIYIYNKASIKLNQPNNLPDILLNSPFIPAYPSQSVYDRTYTIMVVSCDLWVVEYITGHIDRLIAYKCLTQALKYLINKSVVAKMRKKILWARHTEELLKCYRQISSVSLLPLKCEKKI